MNRKRWLIWVLKELGKKLDSPGTSFFSDDIHNFLRWLIGTPEFEKIFSHEECVRAYRAGWLLKTGRVLPLDVYYPYKKGLTRIPDRIHAWGFLPLYPRHALRWFPKYHRQVYYPYRRKTIEYRTFDLVVAGIFFITPVYLFRRLLNSFLVL